MERSYKTFDVHPDAGKTVGGFQQDWSRVTVARDTITRVKEDNEDPDGFLLETTGGPLHVKAKRDEYLLKRWRSSVQDTVGVALESDTRMFCANGSA